MYASPRPTTSVIKPPCVGDKGTAPVVAVAKRSAWPEGPVKPVSPFGPEGPVEPVEPDNPVAP
ncbi:hypothetical protein EBX93_18535 [bacterium]|nr:hypothetical protein [bacterium]